MGFDFNPALWFLCRKCEEPFPTTDELKQHKLETHLEDCLGVNCIIFQEINEPGPKILFQLSTRSRASVPSFSPSASKRKANVQNEATSCTKLVYKKTKACDREGIQNRKNPYVALKPLTQEEINRATKRTADSNYLRESQSILNQQSISDIKPNPRFPDLEPSTEDYNYLNLNQSFNDQNQNLTNLPKPFNDMLETVLLVKDESPSSPLSTASVEEIFTDPLSQELSAPLSTPYPAPEINFNVDHNIFSPSDNKEDNDEDGNSSDSSIEICMEISPIINPSLPILSRCKLCRTPFETPDQTKNHEENCLLHNKERHIYCLCCEREFKTPMKLQKHLLKHNELQVIDPDSKLLQDSDDEDDDEIDEEKDDLLPLDQWIEKRRKNFPDVILLDPEVSLNCNIKGRRIKCKLCSLQLASMDELKEHVKMCWMYNKRNHLYCLACQRSFFDVKRFVSHNRMFHPFKPLPLPSVYCPECYKEFDTFKELREHEDSARIFFRAMMGIKEEEKVESELTSRITSKPVIRRRFTDDDSEDDDDVPITPIPCLLCRAKLVTEKEKRIHRNNCLMHNKARHVYCPGCQTKFQTPLELRRHQNQSQAEGHSQGQGENHCGPIISPEHVNWAEAILSKQEDKRDRNFEPDQNDELNLDLHLPLGRWVLKMRKIIPDTIQLDPDPTTEENLVKPKCIFQSRPITCKLCLSKLISESQAKVHVLTCWAYNKESHRHCVPCKTTFKSTRSLRIHCRNHHPYKSPPLPSFFCVECHEEFRIHAHLNIHMHSAIKFCGLVRKRLLEKLNKC